MIGRGSSCVVYKVLNEENEELALKCVNLHDLPKSQIQDYVNEVKLLRQLHGKEGIIDLVDYEIDTLSKRLLIVSFFVIIYT